MSQVPSPPAAGRQTYEVLDTQGDLSPFGQLLRCAQDPEDASAVLTLRRQGSNDLLSVTFAWVILDHDRESGAIFFHGALVDGGPIDGLVYARPQTEDPEVLGTATM